MVNPYKILVGTPQEIQWEETGTDCTKMESEVVDCLRLLFSGGFFLNTR